MRSFSLAIQRRSGLVLLCTLAVSGLAAVKLPTAYDDDVIRFLPSDDPQVRELTEIARRFGGIHVALVGVESKDLFTAENLDIVRKITLALRTVPAVEFATSATELSVMDRKTSETGEAVSENRDLVPTRIPDDATGLGALRADLLSRDYLAGSLVSHDGTSAQIVCKLRDHVTDPATGVERKVTPTESAIAVRKAAESVARPAGVRLHFGGAPFIAEAAATGSQEDLKRLGPWVGGVIVLLIVLTLGTFKAAVLLLGTVGLGILWTLGAMAWMGKPLTLLSTSLPVMLVALGSAFAVHIVVWYLDHGGDVTDTMDKVGWPVALSALSAIVGFSSFLTMDIEPMREFGWQMAMGCAFLGVIALVVIPALLYRWPIPTRPIAKMSSRLDAWLVDAGESVRSRWELYAGVIALITIGLGSQATKLQTRMDTKSFFAPDSAPAAADDFMVRQFGGSVFLQVLIEGDMLDPGVLRAMAAVEDRLSVLDGVTRIESIARVMAIVNESKEGTPGIARTRGAIANHGGLADGVNPAVRLLVESRRTTEDELAWPSAVLQVAIGGFDTRTATAVTDRVKALLAERLPKHIAWVPRTDAMVPQVTRDAAERILAVIGRPHEPAEPLAKALAATLEKKQASPEQRQKLLEALKQNVSDDENADVQVLVKKGTDLGALATALAALAADQKLDKAAFTHALEAVALPEDLENKAAFAKSAGVAYQAVADVSASDKKDDVLAGVRAQLGPLTGYAHRRVDAIVADLLAPEWAVASELAPGAAAKGLSATVSGYPIVQEAMTRSVHRNHMKSIWTSLPLVLILMWVVFRSLIAALVAMLPAAVTLITTYGLMGVYGDHFPMDIGASMLASIAIGIGIDYAIHFLWRYRESDLAHAMRTTGRRILINAGEVTLGFLVLIFASIAPMSRFGLLTAETLLVAALATLVLLPALLGLWKPTRPVPVAAPVNGPDVNLDGGPEK